MTDDASSTASRLLQEYVAKKIDEISDRKSQRDIAHELGLKSVNFISMIKVGDTKLPMRLVLPMARAIDGDPAYMFRLALRQYSGEVVEEDLNEVLGTRCDAGEERILAFMRSVADGRQIVLTPQLERALADAWREPVAPRRNPW